MGINTKPTILVGDYIKGARVQFIYDPEEHAIYTHGGLGNIGTPVAVHDGRARHLCTVDSAVSGEEVAQWWADRLEDAPDTEEEWDGLLYDFERALRYNEFSSHWDASDWIYGDSSATVAEVEDCATLDDAVAAVVAQGAYACAWLDEDDVRECLVGLLEETLEDLDEDDEDEVARATKLAALLATR